MKIYVAGKVRNEVERDFLEEIDSLCKSEGFDTFLPHRDVGLAEGNKDVPKIFEGDIKEGFSDVKLVVAALDGLHVGAGTAWELGYAYAKEIPAIGIKTDEPVSEALEYLSAILVGSMDIVSSKDELRAKLREFAKHFSQEAS
ncbi:MAG: nucleoside 2-deoxyribosyltransferase [Nanoarchaeota archaeon]|nr:nucleoside 2-deoxyribosyltransferase [Nanoarchaeota archaeon]MBU0977085.1 nucleoside 2-deoxyribosyltransferase [Nanoarchaeota archaeon]